MQQTAMEKGLNHPRQCAYYKSIFTGSGPNGESSMQSRQSWKKPIGSVKAKLLNLAREGLSGEKLALCIALGVVLSIFPVFGTTTLLCAVAAFVFRLNLPLIQLVNYAAYPLQLVLLVPFHVAGSWLSGGHLSLETGSQMIDSLQNDLWSGALQLWDLILYAVLAWILVSPLIALVLYRLLMPVVERIRSVDKKRRFD